MKIRVKGSPEHTSSRKACAALRFYAERLGFHPVTLQNLRIQLDFTPTPGYKAAVEWLDRAKKARSFRISVRPTMSEENVLCAIAHEMVHVHQYASGRLVDLEGMMVRWDEDEVPFDEAKAEEYWLAPWEIEARGYERGLYKLFILSRK